jgi:hypothetical protein
MRGAHHSGTDQGLNMVFQNRPRFHNAISMIHCSVGNLPLYVSASGSLILLAIRTPFAGIQRSKQNGAQVPLLCKEASYSPILILIRMGTSFMKRVEGRKLVLLVYSLANRNIIGSLFY